MEALTVADVEALVRALRKRARFAAGDVVSAEAIAERVVGPVISHRIVSARGMLIQSKGVARIVVHPQARDRNFVIAHELGHYVIRFIAKVKMLRDDEERYANLLAPAILAPQLLLRGAYAWFGGAPAPMARLFGLTQTSTVLRWAEAESEDRVVVTKTQHVLRRGFAAFADHDVRSWARGKAPRGLRKTRLSGKHDAGRVVLMSA